MEDKQVPWWRRALKFALGGIRSAFGIFARPEKSGTAVEQQSANGGEREIKVEDYRIEESEEETELTDISPTPEALEAAIPEAADQLAVPAVPQAPAVMAAPEEQQTTEHSQDEAANQVEAAEYVADELDSAQVQVLETQAAATAADTELDRVAPETESSEAAEIMHEFQAAPIEPESAQSSACANDPVDEGAPLAEAANTGAAAPEFPDPRMELNPTNREETAEDRQPEPEQAVESMANFGETAEESAARAISRPDRTEDAPTVEIEEQTVVASEKSAEPRVNDATKSGTDEAAAEPAPGAGTIAAPAEEQKTVAAPEQRAIGATKTEPAAAVEAPVKHFIKMEARENQIDPSAFSVIVSQVYDGPLDLLLDLIRKQDIDIYDIPIARITAQFLSYVNQLKATDVDVAGEFIYTASLLIHIKSKMLLPRAPAGPDDAAEDPRRELVERLLEHERFKNAAQMLQQKQMLEAATWTNPGVREFRDDVEAEPEIAADTVDLVRVFRDILDRARNRPVLNLQEDSVTVGQMIQYLARRLNMEDKPVALRRLLSHTRSERALIAMFLALLELVRLQAILLRQDRAFSEIFIKKNVEFDAVMNEGLASARDDWR